MFINMSQLSGMQGNFYLKNEIGHKKRVSSATLYVRKGLKGVLFSSLYFFLSFMEMY